MMRLVCRLESALTVLVLLAAGAAPAGAQSKQERHDEMVSIAREMRSIKGNPAARAHFVQLGASYRLLSDGFGGDDPG
ncbi:MAG: hypothetical protein ACREKH_13135, partial [Candidatus Rokuibacteriota bacterium]